MTFIKAVILAIIFAAISWLPVGMIIFEVTGDDELAVIVAYLSSITIFFFSLNKLVGDKNGTNVASAAIGAFKDIKDGIESNLEKNSAEFYAQAEEEYDNSEIDKGLWSQALIKAKGDEALRKFEYMKLRAKQLKKNT